jgi:ribosome recycling factor
MGRFKSVSDLEKKMKTSLDAFRKELNSIRTGRASLSLLDGIAVNIMECPHLSIKSPHSRFRKVG